MGSRYNLSKSGWIDEATFADWFRSIVVPWAENRDGPKAVIGDNLSTLFSPEVLELCQQHNIKFVRLPPNATHLMQPLDVAFFRSLNQARRDILLGWRTTADRRLATLPKYQFPTLLSNLCEAIKPICIKNLQSGSGLVGYIPQNPQPV